MQEQLLETITNLIDDIFINSPSLRFSWSCYEWDRYGSGNPICHYQGWQICPSLSEGIEIFHPNLEAVWAIANADLSDLDKTLVEIKQAIDKVNTTVRDRFGVVLSTPDSKGKSGVDDLVRSEGFLDGPLRSGGSRQTRDLAKEASSSHSVVPTFGQLICTGRHNKGYSQKQLAKMVGINYTYLSKLENDRADYPPSLTVIGALALVLDLDTKHLRMAAGKITAEEEEIFQELYCRYPLFPKFLRRIASDSEFAQSIFAELELDGK